MANKPSDNPFLGREYTESARQAKRFAIFTISLLVMLNIYAALAHIWDLANVFASLSLLIAMYPMWRFLRDSTQEEQLPFFAVIALIYGVYFAFSMFTTFPSMAPLGFNDPITMGVTRPYLVEASMLSCLGIAVMVVSYYLWPASIRIEEIPPFSARWSEHKARFAAVVLGFIGLGATATHVVGTGSNALSALAHTADFFTLIAIGILFYLQLKGRLAVGYIIILWGVFVPLDVLIYISTGSTSPVGRLIGLLLILSFTKNRSMPWRPLIVALIIMVPLMAFKHDYRSEYGFFDSRDLRIASVSGAINRGWDFLGVVGESLTKGNLATYEDSVAVAVNRVDQLYMLGYVMQRTPRSIPYLGGETYSDLLWKFVPRSLYPDKPNPQWGQEFGHRYDILQPTDSATSINISQMTEMYLNFGIPGLVVGMFLVAQIYRFLSYLFNNESTGEWGIISGAVMFSNLANIESNFSLIFGNLLQTLVILYIIGLFVRSRQKTGEELSEKYWT